MFSFSFIVNLGLLLTFFVLHCFRISLIETAVLCKRFQQLPSHFFSSCSAQQLHSRFSNLDLHLVFQVRFICSRGCFCSATISFNWVIPLNLFYASILHLSKLQTYRVSIKSLYNLKKLLKSEMMRYRNEVCFMLISIS